MHPRHRIDHRTAKEIERVLKDKHTELKESVWSVITQRHANGVDRSADPMVWATETLHAEIEVALMDHHGRQVAQIEAALERLGRNEYGICRDCDGFIGLARLRALPFAQRCRPCQSRAELRASPATRPIAAADDD